MGRQRLNRTVLLTAVFPNDVRFVVLPLFGPGLGWVVELPERGRGIAGAQQGAAKAKSGCGNDECSGDIDIVETIHTGLRMLQIP